MLPLEVIKKIRLIDIKTKLLVDEIFCGEYHSVFKGRGIEFSEVREYSYGDDIRTIDWNVTARFGKPFVKVYDEERELTLMLLFDVSSSTLFGSQKNTKRDIMIELAALFTFSAIENSDRVGAILFSDRIVKYVPAQKGKTHALRIVRELVYTKPQRVETNLSVAFDFINNLLSRKSIVIVFSDFFDTNYEKPFKMMVKRHDVIPLIFTDPLEIHVAKSRGLFSMTDIEKGTHLFVDTKDPHVGRNYRTAVTETRIRAKSLFTSLGLDFLELSTDAPYIKPLSEFFHKRAQKL